MARKRFRPTDGKASRKQAARPFRPVFLIACEGETEEDAIRKICRLYGVATPKFLKTGKDPQKTVKNALKLRKQHRDLIKDNPLAECWAVFDRDTHTTFDDALGLAEAEGISLAISNPCFELWLVWLAQDLQKEVSGADAQEHCARAHKGYNHKSAATVAAAAFSEAALRSARERSREMERRHEENGNPPTHNPSSSFSNLVNAIAAAARVSR